MDEDSEVLDMRLRTLMVVAVNVQSLDRAALPASITQAKNNGASDQDIHDTVASTAAFCMYNRYVDGLGTTFHTGELEKSGQSIATYGYRMTFSRIIHEMIPRFIKRFTQG